MRALQRTGLGFGMVLALSLLFAASAEATLVCTGCSHTEETCWDTELEKEVEQFCYRVLEGWMCSFD